MATIPISLDSAFQDATLNSARGSALTGTSHQQISIALAALVHDLRQPLSNIELCADYLNLILPETEPRAREQLGVLLEQVEDANRLICEVLRLLKPAQMQPAKSAQAPAAAS